MSSDKVPFRPETAAVHAGHNRILGAVTTPIFQSSTYAFDPESDVPYDGLRYIRLNNTPNHEVLGRRIAALENTESALVTSSGMSAISATLAACLTRGDHALIQRGIYGGSYSFIADWFERLGVEWDLFEPTDGSQWEDVVRENTRLLYMETITNPTIRIADLPQAAKFGQKHRLTTVVDNTFASPINCRPADFGFDLVIESATKYLNGHSDIVAGVVAGSNEKVDAIRHDLNHLGGSLDPHACFLLERGLKTLPLRVAAQNRTAFELAIHLEGQSTVAKVWYPGLESHPEHLLASEYLSGFGGMISFELADPSDVLLFLKRCKIATHAPSLGGVETLVVLPAKSSHVGLTSEERAMLGISDGLVRVSVGIEHIDDLRSDFTLPA